MEGVGCFYAAPTVPSRPLTPLASWDLWLFRFWTTQGQESYTLYLVVRQPHNKVVFIDFKACDNEGSDVSLEGREFRASVTSLLQVRLEQNYHERLLYLSPVGLSSPPNIVRCGGKMAQGSPWPPFRKSLRYISLVFWKQSCRTKVAGRSVVSPIRNGTL